MLDGSCCDLAPLCIGDEEVVGGGRGGGGGGGEVVWRGVRGEVLGGGGGGGGGKLGLSKWGGPH